MPEVWHDRMQEHMAECQCRQRDLVHPSGSEVDGYVLVSRCQLHIGWEDSGCKTHAHTYERVALQHERWPQ